MGIYKGHGGSVLDVAAAPSGERFVSASQDKNLRVWPTGQAIAVLTHTKSYLCQNVLANDRCRDAAQSMLEVQSS